MLKVSVELNLQPELNAMASKVESHLSHVSRSDDPIADTEEGTECREAEVESHLSHASRFDDPIADTEEGTECQEDNAKNCEDIQDSMSLLQLWGSRWHATSTA